MINTRRFFIITVMLLREVPSLFYESLWRISLIRNVQLRNKF